MMHLSLPDRYTTHSLDSLARQEIFLPGFRHVAHPNKSKKKKNPNNLRIGIDNKNKTARQKVIG